MSREQRQVTNAQLVSNVHVGEPGGRETLYPDPVDHKHHQTRTPNEGGRDRNSRTDGHTQTEQEGRRGIADAQSEKILGFGGHY